MAPPIDSIEEVGEAVVKGTATYRHAVAILATAAMFIDAQIRRTRTYSERAGLGMLSCRWSAR